MTIKPGRGEHRKYLPYAFTEQGVAMLSSVLRSPRAVQVNIEIMRVFVRLRELIGTNRELARRLDELEKRYDAQFRGVFDAIRQLGRSQCCHLRGWSSRRQWESQGDGATGEVAMNAIRAIHQFRHEGLWVFDDEA